MRRFAFLLIVFAALLGAQPVVFDGGVLDGASFAKDSQGRGLPVAAGSLVSIFGTALATQTSQFDSVPFSTSLGGVSVTFNNVPAPMRNLIRNAGSNAGVPYDQLNVQVPWNVLPAGTAGPVSVVVRVNGVASPAQQVQIAQFGPGVYSIPPGVGNAIAYFIEGNAAIMAAPVGSIPGFTNRPVSRGTFVTFYASGLGQVNGTPPANGADSLDATRLTLVTPVVLVGGIAATDVVAALSPQFPGVYQVNARIPVNAPSGNAVSFQIQMGGSTTTNQVTIAVAP
jgi:uncharacterized protein (TIGR03437 family)